MMKLKVSQHFSKMSYILQLLFNFLRMYLFVRLMLKDLPSHLLFRPICCTKPIWACISHTVDSLYENLPLTPLFPKHVVDTVISVLFN